MNQAKTLLLSALTGLILISSATPVLAGGGPVEFNLEPNSALYPGKQYIVHARVYADGSYPTYCKNCYIKLAFRNPQDGDILNQSSERTDNDGRIYAKAISKVSGERTIYVAELKNSDGVNIEANSQAYLPYTNLSANTPVTGAPQMVYPQNGQTIDLEGAYMFKVTPVSGASGYLFGLFQNGVMVYENYRDEKTLSSNGEFALWESNPYHSKFKNGEIKVMVRALVNGQWTEAREIFINLKPRSQNSPVTNPNPVVTTIKNTPVPVTNPKPLVNTQTTTSPTVPSQTILVVNDSSASAELQKRVDDLQKKLEESQRKQEVTEGRLNQLINWIKSVFPLFKS